MKINLYYTTTTTSTNTNTKTCTTTPNEKQASLSSETPSIFHEKFETPPTRKRALQIEESTPESLNSESPNLFSANFDKSQYLTLAEFEIYKNRKKKLPRNIAGSTDLIPGAISPATRSVPSTSQLTTTIVPLDVHHVQEEGSSQNKKNRKEKFLTMKMSVKQRKEKCITKKMSVKQRKENLIIIKINSMK